ncbi:Chitin synthase chs-1 [Dissostichus eleginoides]|uniref:chitin synthase n=1 Tax=Dissostichus eleginoides TaxID=100907 RepID=A0AAD9F2Y5_DISEL|nr:Chitin synthase chs-1 [Dissostichus eleginoides]
MEELKFRGKKREGRHRETWDPFNLNPIGAEKESKRKCFRLAQNLVAVLVGLAVLASAIVSKGSFLVLSTLSSPTSMRSPKEKQFYMLMLVFCLICPNFLVFLKSLWRCAFKSFIRPTMKTMAFICGIECLVSLGTSLLVLVVMPQFDVLTNLFISGGVCIVSAILQIVYRLQGHKWKILFPICSLTLTVTGYCLLGVDYYVRVSSFVDRQGTDCFVYVAIGIFSSLLISLCWWENPLQATNRMPEFLKDMDGYRDFVFIISSILRIIVIGGVYLLYHVLIEKSITWSDFNLQDADWELLQIGLVLFFLQAFCSAACHWFGVVACKIHAVRMSFALPVCCTGPAVLLLGMILFLTQAKQLDGAKQGSIQEFCESLFYLSQKNTTPVVLLEITRSICRTSLNSYYLQWPFSMLALEGVCMWSGFVTCTYYVWKIKVQRIERTSQLFVRRLYESAFIDLSLLLNTKMKVPRAKSQESQDDMQKCVIYLCATMWHETYDEMLKILTSMFRLDRYRGDPNEEHNDCFDFECHIYVDDAYMNDKETNKRLVNSYVTDLIHVVIEVYRLMFVMPEGNMLYIHLKDKDLIRNKKRWSQIMYMYYLLGWKGYIVKNPQKITRQNNPHRDSMISMNGEIFLLPQHDNDFKRKFISDDNTYILALDGDTDFQPKAVILLVDRMRMYLNVGAACGRIHPTGMGPMVWYQKFEYAVGHWLQKTAEHVFGSVLCSPGCFSLFRGSAIMDDNILKKYTTTSKRASEYVQYDQGEDRWLCTLLLQQGWRVEYNAASDAYTNSPEEFKEFYNQRRRWGPSTLANTLDLLHSGKETSKRNSSISGLYIFYQMFTVGSSILGPASVTLMIAGAFQFVFQIAGTNSIIIASCAVCVPHDCILFSIIGDMVIQGTFLTPTGLFLVSMTLMYAVTAILHPEEWGNIIYGLMYFICIPSGYLLLTIYSLVNMNNVSWGTRESNKGEGEVKKNHNMLCDRNCRLCCWDVKIQVSQEKENLILRQIKGQTAEQGSPLPITSQDAMAQQAADKAEPQVELITITTKEEAEKPNKAVNLNDAASCSSDDSFKKRSLTESAEDNEEDDDVMNAEPEERPIKEEFLKKLTYANLKRNLQQQIRYALPNISEEDVCEELVLMLIDTLNQQLGTVGPEDILSESQMEELQHALEEHARRILKTSRMEKLQKKVAIAIKKTLTAPQLRKLEEGEQDFWNKLIDRYLTPINDSQAHKDEVTRELKSLRNKAVFLYFIINVLWVVATFFLQAIGNDVISIKIPKYLPNGSASGEILKVEPLSLMFLLSFAVLLLVQFLAMLYHRVYTLIHVVSYRSSEKDYRQKGIKDPELTEDEYCMTLENHSATGLTFTVDDL